MFPHRHKRPRHEISGLAVFNAVVVQRRVSLAANQLSSEPIRSTTSLPHTGKCGCDVPAGERAKACRGRAFRRVCRLRTAHPLRFMRSLWR